MATKRRATTYQYEPLITPSAWHGDERQFSIRLTQIVDDLYQKYSALRQKLKEIGTPSALEIYPVGSIYMSVNLVDPGTLFGGTWERIKDRFLLAAGDSYAAGATGGEATHTLAVTETPKVTGRLQFRLGDAGTNIVAGYPGTNKDGCFAFTRNGGASWLMQNSGTTNASTNTDLITFDNGGQGQPHNNMPPYLAVYMWKRVA